MGPLLGVLVAFGLIIIGYLSEGGHLGSLIGGPAFLIVVGGTFGAVLVQFTPGTFFGAFKAIGGLFGKPKNDPAKLVDEIVDYAQRARRDGILALERVAPQASDPFLVKALMMAIDGADANALRETMEIQIEQAEEHEDEPAKVFEAIGGYSPTIGIIGAVLGLIHVMGNLSDIAAVGTGIAGAFVATIYGLVLANIFALPLAGRIKAGVKTNATTKRMMLAGVLAIQEGMNPKLVRERLAGFVHGGGHTEGEAGAAAKEAPAG